MNDLEVLTFENIMAWIKFSLVDSYVCFAWIQRVLSEMVDFNSDNVFILVDEGRGGPNTTKSGPLLADKDTTLNADMLAL